MQQKSTNCNVFGDVWKIQETDNIIIKPEKGLLNYELQKSTVGYQKETINQTIPQNTNFESNW